MRKKLIRAVAGLLSAVLLFSSCTEIETVELSGRLIIEAVGIDKDEKGFTVTIEGLDSRTLGTDSSSVSSDKLTRCYSFKGKTIGMAMNSISTATGQLPLFSQARVLILGKRTAEGYREAVLDFFRREYTTRTDILIAVGDTTAEKMLKADYGKNISAGKIIETSLSSGKYTGRSIYMPLYKFLNALSNETDSAFCPLIALKDSSEKGLKEIDLTGTIAFYGKKSSVLNGDETLALSVMLNKTENGDLTVDTDKGICTLEIIDCRTRVKTKIADGRVHFFWSASLRCDIPEVLSESFTSLSSEDTEKIALLTAEKLTEMQTDIFSKYYYGQNFDIFRIGRRINLKSHTAYLGYLSSEDNGNITCHISTTVSIRRIGKILLKNTQMENMQPDG